MQSDGVMAADVHDRLTGQNINNKVYSEPERSLRCLEKHILHLRKSRP